MVRAVLPYRARQVYDYLGVRNSEPPTLPPDALARLPEPMLHQFRILSNADQRHALRVYAYLVSAGADDETVTAGLIHDVGKACAKCRITVIDRGLNVMLKRLLPPLHRMIAGRETAPERIRGLHRLANHPERGALAAKQAGYSDRVADLVRLHEGNDRTDDAQLALLRYADDVS